MQLIDAMSRIGGESSFVVLAKAKELERQGKDIIHLQIGEPDFPTPANIVEAGRQALADGKTKYGPTQGLLEFRESIARYVSRTRGIEVGPERVCVVPGAKPIMYYAMIALLNAGDEVDLHAAGFPDLRVDGELPGREEGSGATARGTELQPGYGRVRIEAHR